MLPPLAATSAMPLAQSWGEPPPSEMTQSQPLALIHGQTRFDVAGSGVGFGLIENSAFNTMFSQQGGELGDHADLVENFVGDDQRLAIAVTLDIGGSLLQTAGTHQVDCGNIEFECSHDGLPIVSH